MRSRSADRLTYMPPSWRKGREPAPESPGPLQPTGLRAESKLLDQQVCGECGKSKPVGDFFDKWGKRKSFCRPCRIAWMKSRRAANAARQQHLESRP